MPVYFPGNGLPAGVKPVGFRKAGGARIVGIAGSVDLPLSEMLGPSFVSRVGTANPNDGKMRVRVANGNAPFPVMIEAAFPIAGGKYIVHQLGREKDDGFLRHYSAYIAEKVMAEQVHLSNGVNDESAVINIPAPVGAAWSNTTGKNPYTATVGTTLTFQFIGTGLDLRPYCNSQGGAWQISVDGVNRGQITTYDATPGWYTREVVRGLPHGLHNVTMTFVGADGINTPTAGGPRGWISRSEVAVPTGADLRSYGMVRVANLAEVYNNIHQLSAPGSNMEAAITLRKNGAAYSAQFWPFHAVTGVTAMVGQVAYIDGYPINLDASDAEFKDASRIDVVQTFTVQLPAEPTAKLADGFMRAMLTADGYEYTLTLGFATDVEVSAAYGPMCAAYNSDRIEWNSGLSQDTAVHDNTVYGPSARLADSGWLSDAYHNYVWAYDILDWQTTMRAGRVGSKQNWGHVQARQDGTRMTKSYNHISPGNPAVVWPAGERVTVSARYRGGVAPASLL